MLQQMLPGGGLAGAMAAPFVRTVLKEGRLVPLRRCRGKQTLRVEGGCTLLSAYACNGGCVCVHDTRTPSVYGRV